MTANWLPYNEKSLLNFPSQKGTRQNLLLCHTCKTHSSDCRDYYTWPCPVPGVPVPQLQTRMNSFNSHPSIPSIAPALQGWELLEGNRDCSSSSLKFGLLQKAEQHCAIQLYCDIPFASIWWRFSAVHPPNYKPCTRWAVTHQKQQEDNTLPCRNIKKSNMNRCRFGARGGIFFHVWMQHWDWAVLADTMDFTARSFQIGVCWRRKKEKDWQNEGSAWREWLRCGNLPIFEAQKRLCLGKTQGKQHNFCLAGLHYDSYSWCSVKIEGLVNFALQLKLQCITSTIPEHWAARKLVQVLKIRQGTGSLFPQSRY